MEASNRYASRSVWCVKALCVAAKRRGRSGYTGVLRRFSHVFAARYEGACQLHQSGRGNQAIFSIFWSSSVGRRLQLKDRDEAGKEGVIICQGRTCSPCSLGG